MMWKNLTPTKSVGIPLERKIEELYKLHVKSTSATTSPPTLVYIKNTVN